MKLKFITLMACILNIMGCKAQSPFKSVSVDEFEKIIASKNTLLLDVRTADEYAEGHIAFAINIDVKGDDFESKADTYLDKSRLIAVYCRSGNRSKKACNILTAKGYKVIELSTGIMGWQDAEKAVTRGESDMFTTTDGSHVYMHCIKHGTLSINIGDKWIYVDPVTDKIPPVTDYTCMPKADYILITHEHADHLDAKAIQQLSVEGTHLITNPRSNEILGGAGQAIENFESLVDDNGWIIDAVPAYNISPEKKNFHPQGRDNGYILTIEGLRIYIAGDTEPIPEMKKIKDIDIAFLPCNLPFTMTPQQFAEAAKTIRPKVLFPYHYGQTDIKQVVTLLDGSGIDVRIRQYQ